MQHRTRLITCGNSGCWHLRLITFKWFSELLFHWMSKGQHLLVQQQPPRESARVSNVGNADRERIVNLEFWSPFEGIRRETKPEVLLVLENSHFHFLIQTSHITHKLRFESFAFCLPFPSSSQQYYTFLSLSNKCHSLKRIIKYSQIFVSQKQPQTAITSPQIQNQNEKPKHAKWAGLLCTNRNN